MDKFELIVIGSGAGTHVASQAVKMGWNVALVDRGPTGGTCLNNGCIPSKMLIYPADVVRAIQNARSVGVEGSIDHIDFPKIMSRMRSAVNKAQLDLEEAIAFKENLTYFRESSEFVGEYILKAGDAILTAPKLAIASGARPLVPPIAGLNEAGYLDNISLLNLEEPPKSLIIIGAGYIGCEFGHFFSAMGSDVTILGRSPCILKEEEPEVRRVVHSVLSKYLQVITGHEAIEVKRKGDKKMVNARNIEDGNMHEFEADEILLAAGRRSNSDLLKPEKTGVETDRHGWIKVNDYLETTKKGIWAFGDAIGKHMFRHTANYESRIVSHNLLHADKMEDKKRVDFHAVPHAVFTYPQVASVGIKEADALAAGLKVLVGRAKYLDVAKGLAMAEENGLAKVVLEEETGRIVGASVVGPMAPELIQQVVFLMNTEHQDLDTLMKSQIIHPAISEVLVKAFFELERPDHGGNEQDFKKD